MITWNSGYARTTQMEKEEKMTTPHCKPDHEDLCNLRATQVLDLLKQKAISPIDLVDASIKRIEAVD